MQGVFLSKIHTREFFIPVMDRCGALGVLYQGVVALPIPVRFLMKLHFDLYPLVDRLNHSKLLRSPPAANRPP